MARTANARSPHRTPSLKTAVCAIALLAVSVPAGAGQVLRQHFALGHLGPLVEHVAVEYVQKDVEDGAVHFSSSAVVQGSGSGFDPAFELKNQ